MPKIPINTAEVQASGQINTQRLNASDLAPTQGMQNLAEGIGTIGQLLEKHASQEDISNSSAAIADGQAAYTKYIQDATQQGNLNPDKVMEEARAHFGRIQESIETPAGKSYFQKVSPHILNSLQESAFNAKMKLDGEKAVQNYTTSINGFSTAALNAPGSFETQLNAHRMMLDESVSVGGMDAGLAMRLKSSGDKEIAKSAVLGLINVNPPMAEEKLKSGQFDNFMDGTDKEVLLNKAHAMQAANIADAERQKRQAEDLAEKAREQTQIDFLKKKESGTLTDKEILNSNLKPFGSGSMDQMIKLNNTEGVTKSDPVVFRDLFSRINLPDGNPKKMYDEGEINQAYIDKKISYEGLNQLRNEMIGSKSPEGKERHQVMLRAYNEGKAAFIQPTMMGKDSKGTEIYNGYVIELNKELQNQVKSGKSFYDLMDPNSKDYLPRKIIDSKRRSPVEVMNDNAALMSAQPKATPAAAALEIGTIKSGFKYIGGNPAKRESWEKVQ